MSEAITQAELLEQELNARKHAHYERFMAWYRDEMTEDFVLWAFQRIDKIHGVLSTIDAHDSVKIAYEQGCLNTLKEVAYGAMFRRYAGDREQEMATAFMARAIARGFDPKADWSEIGDIGFARESI